ncbi:hypothetical protein [Legionella jamestowniensis]|uniref:Uncharacterized protein n=1 Tax=Legionella jamestowniensis TaxID=455 RepID=A0A0W0UIR4_9GAMM|nr:hypothetical protein [Legionella jamestowniensis]KTD07695.1 hypothetical protein Ljam_1890 [Legionella jamestowniensis]SFL60783.1 hypothetical protein SAMN02746073_1009 [Legionella jamestowniensis DSM 19215]
MPNPKPPHSTKPSLQKRKAVRNLKEIATSSTNQFFQPNNTSPPGFSESMESSKEKLQYESLKSNLGKTINNYFLYAIGAYIYFNSRNRNKENEGASKFDKRSLFAQKKQETGWKLHLSVDPTQVSLAWTLIYPILMENDVSAKILSHESLMKKSMEKVSNKQITLYEFKNKHINSEEWSSMLQQIEDKLRQHGIGPSNLPPADKQIPNSVYFSYRNDTDHTGKYISGSGAKNYVSLHGSKDPQLVPYNLIKAQDPFEEVSLKPYLDNQMDSALHP